MCRTVASSGISGYREAMERVQSPWAFQVSLRLGEHGWSELDLWIERTHHQFCLTHVFNSPLEEIAAALEALTRGAADIEFTLHEEPGQHVWRITRVEEARHLLEVSIQSYQTNFDTSDPCAVIEFRAHRDFFKETLLSELDKIAGQLSFKGFAENRNAGDFPWAAWRRLRTSGE